MRRQRSGAISGWDEVWVYFDSGVRWSKEGYPNRVDLGFVSFNGQPNPDKASGGQSCLSSPIGAAIASWDPPLARIWQDNWDLIVQSAWARGTQLYDLIAARGAALHLKTNGCTRRARFLGDGDQVIRYMNGEDSQVSIQLGDVDIAARIRDGIRADLAGLSSVTWVKIPRELNMADRAIRELLAKRPKGLGRRNEWS